MLRDERTFNPESTFMAMLFRVRRDERRAWVVLIEDQVYGEYLGKDQAVLDAIDAVKDTRAAGGEAEVWDETTTLRLY
jgi:hypothetical protein